MSSSEIKEYKEILKHQIENNCDSYSVGLFNGLELSLSIIEKREPIYLNKEGKYNEKDVYNFPEHFI